MLAHTSACTKTDRKNVIDLISDFNVSSKNWLLQIVECPAYPLKKDRIVDTTGCGDAFWGGFLHSFKTMNCHDHFVNMTVAAQVAALKATKLGPNAGCPYAADVSSLHDLKPS